MNELRLRAPAVGDFSTTLALIGLLLLSGSIYAHTAVGLLVAIVWAMAALALCCVQRLSSRFSVEPQGYRWVPYLALAAALLLTNFVFIGNQAYRNDLILSILALILVATLVLMVRSERIISQYVRLMCWMSGAAVLSVVISVLLGDSLQDLPLAGSRYVQDTWCAPLLCFQQPVNEIPGRPWRAQLLFWEPGVLGLHLVTAFVVAGRASLRARGLLAVGVLSTFSTTSMAALMLAVPAIASFQERRFRLGTLLAVLIFAVAFGGVLWWNFVHKSDLSNIERNQDLLLQSSYYLRLMDMRVGWEALVDNYLTGTGFKVSAYGEGAPSEAEEVRQGTSGILVALYQLGMGAMVWFLPLLVRMRDWRSILKILAFLIGYAAQPLTFAPMYYLGAYMVAQTLEQRASARRSQGTLKRSRMWLDRVANGG